VFVGRVEMLSPARIKGLQAAAAARDRAVLGKYERFLEAFWVQHVPTPFPAEMRVTQGGCAQ
jgi:hypothetical protein